MAPDEPPLSRHRAVPVKGTAAAADQRSRSNHRRLFVVFAAAFCLGHVSSQSVIVGMLSTGGGKHGGVAKPQQAEELHNLVNC